MPVWHEAAKEAVAAGEVILLGITQEQHPERCELFAQWKEFDWPILHDPINLLGAVAVPLVVGIDEHGVVRQTRMRPDNFRETFLEPKFSAVDIQPKRMNLGPNAVPQLALAWKNQQTAESAREFADALMLWESPRPLDSIIKLYRQAIELDDPEGRMQFRLGVALRMRFESGASKESDFQEAVDAWGTALTTSPNQYIWRRRIQQYGPRLDKPYPFYDWVESAREEIASRGESPIELPVEPNGAELAQPARALAERESDVRVSDPSGRVTRDDSQMIALKTIVVQGTGRSNRAFRVHLELKPRDTVHWNNETDPLVVWLEAPANAKLETTALSYEQPDEAESQELRHIEFEVHRVESTEPIVLKGYALYNICEDENGQCLFRRQDFQVQLGN